MAHTLVFIAFKPDFYVRMYYYFLGNYSGFTVRGYYILKRKMFSKTLFLPTHVFYFAPLQV